MDQQIWIIGAGEMAIEYAKVLRFQQKSFKVIGRSELSAKKFKDQTGQEVVCGGLEAFLSKNPKLPSKVIVTVGIEALAETTIRLMEYGVKDILLEKPGVGNPAEINSLVEMAQKTSSTVLLAYNRRFYSSVLKAEEIIKQDGGVKSLCFEFTEWSHVISGLKKTSVEHNFWFLGNSTHVVDLAFFLSGKPKDLKAFYKGSLNWHPASSTFSGAGITTQDALFSYHANWESPGRWWLDILTSKHRLIFKPMESLRIQEIGSVAEKEVEIDNKLDKEFKPGLFLQTKAYLENDFSRFSNIFEQKEMIENVYLKMSGYSLKNKMN